MINIFNWQVYNFVEKPKENAIHWYKSYTWRLYGNLKKKKKAQVWANLEANLWRLIVSLLHWGVTFQINCDIEKIWWWGMITNIVNSPNNLYLEAKNQNISRYGGYIYVTLSCNMLFCLQVDIKRWWWWWWIDDELFLWYGWPTKGV